MAIALKKLSAGSGYEYLTRTVAALDASGRGHTTLADYYTAKGETPGTWWGAGLGGVGLAAGDRVGEEQMKLLFGAGLNPTTGEQLGRRYSVFGNEPTPFEAEVARRLQAWQDANGGTRPGRAVCRQVRTGLGREWFTAEHGVPPEGPRELHGFIAKASSHPRVAVAGFDATFSPPKSVSALWALAPRPLAAAIRAAHEAAVTDALTEAEARVLFTRTGHKGARNVPVEGMVAARFDHRDSRAGDPDLHTHVAIANKVHTDDGHWMTIDAAVLYAAKVTLSEVYLTSLTARLRSIGLTLVPVVKEGKRPVFEIAGVDPRLNARWSSRRHRITAATSTLVAQFEADHERPPTPIEKLDLAQQATLDTRQGKHQPRSEADQRAAWAAETHQLLGRRGVDQLLQTVWSQPRVAPPVVDEAWFSHAAQHVLTAMEADRSSWTPWNVRSEALRQVRAAAIPLDHIPNVVDRVVDKALTTAESVPIRTRRVMPVEPDLLRRPDATSMYDKPSATRYTSRRILWAEHRLIDTAGRLGGRVVDHNSVTLALLQSMTNREPLNPGQQLLVRDMATSGRRLQLAIAPAGTGKTTAMRALATAWTGSGGTIVGLAPSAAAAEQLRTQLGAGIAADNLAKLVWAISHHEPLATAIGPDTLVIIDEAGMADTLTLDHIVTFCLDQGASIRLIGDDQQLGAIGAGGVLRDIAAEHGALRLNEVMRFADPAEADASLALRTGDVGALGYYLDHGRIHVVDPDTATTALLTAWHADRNNGLDALMLAPTRQQVAQLNHAARAARLHGQRTGSEVELSDDNHASAGDIVITRRNNRTLTTGETAWVRNGDRWQVTKVHRDGSLDVQHLRNRNQLTLPVGYVTESVELGYATTIHGAQGVTADTCHGLITGEESRQQAYTMLTRGRHANHAWIQATGADTHLAPVAQELLEPATATSILEMVIARDDAPASATTLLARADEPGRLLGPAATCYLDAIGYAAEHHLPQHVKDAIDTAGKAHRLTDADAWPTLRSNLMLLAASGHNPAGILDQAVALGGMETARDRAAVITYRLDLTQASAGRTRGPLPWLPGIPTQLLDDPYWKTYLSDRYQLTRQLGQETREAAETAETPPRWAEHLPRLDPALLADIEVWRAANQIPDTDLRPTGPQQFSPAEHDTQRRLEHRLETAQAGIREWAPRITDAAPEVAGDPRLAIHAARLAALSRTRADIPELLTQAAAQGHLPDDHPADALGYRITTLTKKTARAHEPWETITPGDLERRRHHEPPSMHSPGHSPGIGI